MPADQRGVDFDTQPPERQPSRSPLRRVFRAAGHIFTIALALAALVHPLARSAARLDWRIDLITHFYVLAFCVTIFAAVAIALTRRFRLACIYVVLVAIQATLVFRFAGTNPVPPLANAPTIRVVMLNAFMGRIDYEETAAMIRRERPDVLALVEVRQNLVERLEKTGIHHDFPYRYVHPVGAQGQLLWFRQKPIAVDEPKIFAPQGNPVYRATVSVGGRPVRLWLVHPPNPIGRGRERANGDLKAIGVAVGEEGGSRIVIGDLNRTEGSPFFDDFVRDSGLRDSRFGFGPQPSWPSHLLYRIPIDQAFVSNDLAVVDRRLGPQIGSDHLPILLEIAPVPAARDVASSTN